MRTVLSWTWEIFKFLVTIFMLVWIGVQGLSFDFNLLTTPGVRLKIGTNMEERK